MCNVCVREWEMESACVQCVCERETACVQCV